MDNPKYHTGLKRLGAAVVDGVVFMPLLLVGQWIFRRTDKTSLIFSWTIFITFLPIVYSVFAHYKYGQTIGKWVTGVKVLDISEGRKINLQQSVLRDSFYLTIEIIGLLYFLFLFLQPDKTQNALNDYTDFANQPILWWTVIELISMLTNSKRRAVHDFLAKSVVVAT